MKAESSIAPERLAFLFDDDLDSRWLSGAGQNGNEAIDIVFDRPHDVARARIETSARSIGNYPRHLIIESVQDNGSVRVLFDGSVLVPLGEGLVTDSIREPIDLWLPENHTKRMRLRQTGQSRTWFWAIDELKVFEADTNRNRE